MTLSPANTTVFAGGRSFRPVGLVYEPRNELVFCVDGTGGEIWQIDVRANTIGQAYNNYGSAPGQLMNPTGIELVAGEFPAVSDWGTNRVTISQLSAGRVHRIILRSGSANVPGMVRRIWL